MAGLSEKGPTLSSLDGIVRLNGAPLCEVNSMEIEAGRVSIKSQAMPYVPASVVWGTMLGEMSAYIAFLRRIRLRGQHTS